MHLSIKFAISIGARLERTHVSGITFWVPAMVGEAAWQAPPQIPQCVQMLTIQSPIVARFAAWVWTIALEEMVIAELLRAKPYDHRLLGIEGRVDSQALGVAEDCKFRRVDCRPVFCVTKDAWEGKPLQGW